MRAPFVIDCRSALIALVLLSPASAAPPQVTSLFPAGGQRGQTVAVTAGGSFSTWPVRARCSRAGVEIQCEKDKGKLTVAVPADTSPGVAWIRLMDDEGAASPRPFVIGTLPEANEQEPNDDPRKPQLLDLSSLVVNGVLAKSGDVDTFAIPLVKGQTLVASLEANRTLGSPMDGVLQVVSAAGFVLAQNDDDHALDPQVVYTATSDGIHLVRTFAFPATPNSSITFAGGETFIYRLTLTTGPFVDAAFPLTLVRGQSNRLELFGWNLPESLRTLSIDAPAEGSAITLAHAELANTLPLPLDSQPAIVEQRPDPQSPQKVELPATITGRLSAAGEVDVYSFEAKKGQQLSLAIQSRGLGYPLDPHLRVLDAAGKNLVQADDKGRESRDPELAFAVPDDGEYHVAVRDLTRHGGPRYVYRLQIAQARSDFELKLAADAFSLTAGKPLEIPVTIDRQGGFAEEIELSVVGLPEAVTVAAAKSLAKGDSAKTKTVKLVLTCGEGTFSGPIRIEGVAAGEAKLSHTAAAPLAGLGATIEDVWLTVAPAKK